MSVKRILAGICAVLTGCAFGAALAKLPPPTEEQKAKAAEAKAKADEGAKKEAELLGTYQDRAADRYKKAGVAKTSATAPVKK
jgi:hypothetical protein